MEVSRNRSTSGFGRIRGVFFVRNIQAIPKKQPGCVNHMIWEHRFLFPVGFGFDVKHFPVIQCLRQGFLIVNEN